MSNIFFVHMAKDVGRYLHFKTLQNLVGGSIWDGKCVIPVDDKGYVLNRPTQPSCTQAAKEAKIKLFRHFLATDKDSDKLILFEDDLIWHKNFKEHMHLILESLYKLDEWKLVYFGVSSSIEYDVTKTRVDIDGSSDLYFSTLDASLKVYTGAYGVIINRTLLQEIIERASVPELKGKPFDATCLGYMQKKYQGECFLVQPQQILADVSGSNIRFNRNQKKFNEAMNWNFACYVVPVKLPFLVLADNNINRIERFLYQCNALMPVIQLHFILTTHPHAKTKDYLINCRKKGITYSILPSCDADISHNLKHHIITNKLIKKNDYDILFLTNIYLSWNHDLSKDMFSQITKNAKTNMDGVSWTVKNCDRCNPYKAFMEVKVFYHTLSCIKIESFIKKKLDELSFLYLDNNLYLATTCLEISDNTFHNLTLNEIKTILSDVKNEYLTMDSALKYHGDNVWIQTVLKWLHKYFYKTILGLIGKEYDEALCMEEIYAEKHYAKNFNTTDFNILKFVQQTLPNGIMFIMDYTFIKNTFGTNETILFETLCKKYGIEIPTYYFRVLFKLA